MELRIVAEMLPHPQRWMRFHDSGGRPAAARSCRHPRTAIDDRKPIGHGRTRYEAGISKNGRAWAEVVHTFWSLANYSILLAGENDRSPTRRRGWRLYLLDFGLLCPHSNVSFSRNSIIRVKVRLAATKATTRELQPSFERSRKWKRTSKAVPERSRREPTYSVSRRRFLCAAAAGRLAIVPRHVLGGPGYVAPSDKTTLAGIGLGGQGSQNITSLMQFPEVQVVAVCDVNREGGGYQSWNWAQGKEQRTAGREPARRAVEEFYAKEKGPGQVPRLPRL